MNHSIKRIKLKLEDEVEVKSEIVYFGNNKNAKRKLNEDILCDICNKIYTTKVGLNYHVSSEHKKIKYPCNQCDYQATTKGSLKKHIESVHEKIKYTCNQCDYQATSKGHLKKHVKRRH